jgi:glycosyltransferase involved in cell wall biosynthesis
MDNPKQPLVSIIVPQYNRKEFLYNNLSSMVSQTYKNIEVLVVNDGGEDVKDIVDSFKDIRIKYLTKPNGGLASARNHGMKYASGDYYCFIDQDDGAFPHHLAELVPFAVSNRYDVVYCDSIRMIQEKDESGKYQIVHRDMPYSVDYDQDRLFVTNISPVNCFMVHKRCFNYVPKFDETVKVYEDYRMWLELSLKYDFHHYAVPLVWHTWREDQTSMSSSLDFSTPLPEIYMKYWQYVKPESQLWVAQNINAVLKSRGMTEMFKIS